MNARAAADRGAGLRSEGAGRKGPRPLRGHGRRGERAEPSRPLGRDGCGAPTSRVDSRGPSVRACLLRSSVRAGFPAQIHAPHLVKAKNDRGDSHGEAKKLGSVVRRTHWSRNMSARRVDSGKQGRLGRAAAGQGGRCGKPVAQGGTQIDGARVGQRWRLSGRLAGHDAPPDVPVNPRLPRGCSRRWPAATPWVQRGFRAAGRRRRQGSWITNPFVWTYTAGVPAYPFQGQP